MRTPNPRFGRFTLRTRKERAENRQEAEWAARSGEVTTRHIQDEPLHTKTGKLLTPQELEKYVHEAEHGYPIHTMTVEEYLNWINSMGPDDIKRHFQSDPPQFTDTEMRDLAESLGQALLGDGTTLRPAKTREEENENE